jgi:hypothetical protein
MIAGFVCVLLYYIIYIFNFPPADRELHSMFRMCGCQVVERALVIRVSGGLSGYVKRVIIIKRTTVI